MSPNRFMAVCSLLLIMFLCHELMAGCVEGRNLKSRDEKMIGDTGSVQAGGHQPPSYVMQQEGASKAEQLDDFRPTTPGHSPGVGHAIKN